MANEPGYSQHSETPLLEEITLKSIRTFAFILLALLQPAALFAQKHSKQVNFDQTTKVGSTELKPGNYKVVWDGEGPDVEVNFQQNNKTMANATAKLANAPGPYDAAVVVTNDSTNAVVLEELDFKNLELVFSQPSPAVAGQ